MQLIDLATRKTVREATSQATKVHAGLLGAPSAWVSMTAEEKMQDLQRMIRQAVTEGVAKVLSQP